MHEPKRRNRWIPEEVGFLNFWVYQEETYPFHNGNILFRGENGQGKSVSMQSIIPLLLDGNTHPSRIDPFGSGKRKIIDYLKVRGQVEKGRISYIYLTYKKRETNETITTGIGLKATNETDVEFWGFVIKDKKIGKDFLLSESIGYSRDGVEEFAPLLKKKLKKQIEDMNCGSFVDSKKDYAEAVNNQVFQFEDVESFKELTNLLIQIRSPKLSKEMKPDILYEALKNSLGELPSADFSMISNTIKDIDDYNRKIEKTTRDVALAETLSIDYKLYQQETLGNAAYRFSEVADDQKRTSELLEKKDKQIVHQMAKLEKINQQIKEMDLEENTKKDKLDKLESPEIRAHNNEKQKKIEDKSTKEESFTHKKNQLETNESTLLKLNHEVRGLKDTCFEIEKNIGELLRDLDDSAEYIQFHENKYYRTVAIANVTDFQKDKQYFTIWQSQLKEHIQSLKAVLTALDEEKRVQTDLTNKKEEIRVTESEMEGEEKEKIRLDKRFQADKDQYKKTFRSWIQNNQEFHLSTYQIGEMMNVIENLYEFQDMKPKIIEGELQDTKQHLQETINEEMYVNRSRIQLAEETIEALNTTKQELENEKERVPYFRHQLTTKHRQQLEENGVPFIPFYQSVDFSKVCSNLDQERIESALMDMGILDRLIVPSEYRNQVGDNDAFIIPHVRPASSHTLDAYLDVVLPKGSGVSKEEVLQVLKSISMENLSDGTYLATSGAYQHGLVKGVAATQSSATLIGEESRRRFREQQLHEIAEKINTQETMHAECKKNIQELEARKTQVGVEYENRPSLDEFETIHNERNKVKDRIGVLDGRREKLFYAHEGLVHLFKTKQNLRVQASMFLSGIINAETISSLVEASENEYNGIVGSLERHFHKYETKKTLLEINQGNVEKLEETIDEVKGEIYRLERQILGLQNEIQNIDDILKGLGIEEIEKEILLIRHRLRVLTGLIDDHKNQKPRVESDVDRLKNELSTHKNELTFIQKLYKAREEIFLVEIRANQIESSQPLEEIAISYQKVQANVSDALQALNRSVSEIRFQGLEDYSLTSKDSLLGHTAMTIEKHSEKKDTLELLHNEKKRLNVTLSVNGVKQNPLEFYSYLVNVKEQQESYLKKEEEALIKNVLIQGTGEKIRELILKAKTWKDEINDFMKTLNNSIGLRLLWEPIEKTDTVDSIATSKLVDLLGRDFSTLKDRDVEALSRHFMAKINSAKDRLNQSNNKEELENLEQALKQVLDYRDWYKFKIMYKLEGEEEKTLNADNLAKLSGGEKAMAIYIPLFSAAFSKYSTSSPDAPYMIALDEAFAGVDENNISEMFALMEQLEFDYILTSQALWCDYPTVSGINIYELIFDKVEQFVFSEPWQWNGTKREINKDVLAQKGLFFNEDNKIEGQAYQEEFVLD
jgi:uncharacterized protein (TIGR02680 family)